MVSEPDVVAMTTVGTDIYILHPNFQDYLRMSSWRPDPETAEAASWLISNGGL